MSTSADWLSTELAKLLASPHISFPKPPPGIHLGPGPVDLFSTYFSNLFSSDVRATVDGDSVSRDVLKQKLLNLQKHWNPEEVKFQQEAPKGLDLATVATLPHNETVCFLAETEDQGGRRVIKIFAVNADTSLFQ